LVAAVVAFVHWYKEPTLARRFGAEYEADRKQAPAGCRAARRAATPMQGLGPGTVNLTARACSTQIPRLIHTASAVTEPVF
jgi:hypothetical protein